MNAKQLMIGVGFSMMAALSLPAQANDAKTLPGAACQPQSNDQAFSINNSGVLFNNSRNRQTVVCPVVRDTMAADASGIVSAQIYVIDNNNTRGDPRVSCTLESRRHNANITLVENATDRSRDGASPDAQVLDDYVNIESSQDGYYYFRCSIPGTDGNRKSGIVMYRVNEKD